VVNETESGRGLVVLLMGVAGAGKTTVGRQLAAAVAADFYDADDFHPRANVEKMRRGVPLTDADRAPWLATLHELIETCLARGARTVLACSALKESYRAQLLIDERVKLVYLKGDFALIQARLKDRRDHFMSADMLDSQFAALEEPQDALRVDAAAPPAEIVRAIRDHFRL
jgi:gluconokinase